jgi:hypothetical protein
MHMHNHWTNLTTHASDKPSVSPILNTYPGIVTTQKKSHTGVVFLVTGEGYCLSSWIPSGHWWGDSGLQQKIVQGTDVRESHPLPTVSVEAHPPCAKSSFVGYLAAGGVPSFASRFCAAVKNEPNTITVRPCTCFCTFWTRVCVLQTTNNCYNILPGSSTILFKLAGIQKVSTQYNI